MVLVLAAVELVVAVDGGLLTRRKPELLMLMTRRLHPLVVVRGVAAVILLFVIVLDVQLVQVHVLDGLTVEVLGQVVHLHGGLQLLEELILLYFQVVRVHDLQKLVLYVIRTQTLPLQVLLAIH